MKHIPDDKPYYRIGEVARLLGVPTHVLRYWESEFPQLKPVRAPSGHRLYHRRHIALAAHIQRLVRDEGLTIAGAKKRLAAQEEAGQGPRAAAKELAGELREILKLIS